MEASSNWGSFLCEISIAARAMDWPVFIATVICTVTTCSYSWPGNLKLTTFQLPFPSPLPLININNLNCNEKAEAQENECAASSLKEAQEGSNPRLLTPGSTCSPSLHPFPLLTALSPSRLGWGGTATEKSGSSMHHKDKSMMGKKFHTPLRSFLMVPGRVEGGTAFLRAPWESCRKSRSSKAPEARIACLHGDSPAKGHLPPLCVFPIPAFSTWQGEMYANDSSSSDF